MKLLLLLGILFLFGCKSKREYGHKDGYDPDCSICKNMSESERLSWIHDNHFWNRDTIKTKWVQVDNSSLPYYVGDSTSGDIVYTSGSNKLHKRLPVGAKGQIVPIATGKPAWVKSNDVGMSTKLNGVAKIVGYNEKSGMAYLGTDTNGRIDTLPIHWTSDSSTAYFDLDDMESYFSITDSTGELARRNNKTRKWTIRNCKRALEVVYQMDSIKNADYDIEFKPKNKNKK